MTLEPERPLRRVEHAGRQVGLLVWTENGTWRSAWRLDSGAWHSVRGTSESEEHAAQVASNAAQEHIQSGRSVPRRAARERAEASNDETPMAQTPSPGTALTSESWRARHTAWTQANDALAAHRDALPEEPTRPQIAMLRLLEARAEEARRAMDGQLSRILRPQRRRPGVPRENDTDTDSGSSER